MGRYCASAHSKLNARLLDRFGSGASSGEHVAQQQVQLFPRSGCAPAASLPPQRLLASLAPSYPHTLHRRGRLLNLAFETYPRRWQLPHWVTKILSGGPVLRNIAFVTAATIRMLSHFSALNAAQHFLLDLSLKQSLTQRGLLPDKREIQYSDREQVVPRTPVVPIEPPCTPPPSDAPSYLPPRRSRPFVTHGSVDMLVPFGHILPSALWVETST